MFEESERIQAFRCSSRRLISRLRRSAAAGALVILSACPAVVAATCPIGDPAIPFCEEFSGSNPLVAYTIVNPMGANYPFTIGINNEALVFTNNYPGLAFAAAVSNNAIPYRNSRFEADLRFNTQNPYLRSAMDIAWSTVSNFWSERILMNLQLDEKKVVFGWGSAGSGGDRRYPLQIDPNKTYRLALEITEVPGASRPNILSFTGYVNGTLVFHETEDSLGVDLSTLPALMSPTFQSGSYPYSPVDQIYDNAIVREQMTLTCVGFEPPLASGPVMVNKNRALPFKAGLVDKNGNAVTSLGAAPPVIQITYASSSSGDATDVTALAVPVGLGTGGNQFVYADGKWQFNLQTKAYTAPGTYTIAMVPGNSYQIQPTCMASFVVR